MSQEFRQLLDAGDVEGLRAAWHTLMPGMPQPETRRQAEIVMHLARTGARSMTLAKRAYSHRWLLERDLPSSLPEELKPEAERMFPKVVEGVGVSVNFTSRYLQPAAEEIQTSMNVAIENCYADGDTAPEFVLKRMLDARDASMRKLFGGLRTH